MLQKRNTTLLEILIETPSSMLFIADLIHICVNELHGALQHKADRKTFETLVLTMMLRRNHPLANAANE